MPELPEVETVCRALKPILEGKSLLKIQVKRADLRYPLPLNLENTLKTKTIYRVRRRAKYILIDFNPELTLVWHLGMSGRVIIEKVTNPLKNQRHDHVIFITSEGYKIIFRDPRRFGFMQLYSTNELEKVAPFNLLGPEPIGDKSFTAAILHAALKHRSVSIKNALLNQHIIAGLGNIYVSEALWQACLSPLRSAKTLSLKETKVLLKEIQQVLKRAIKAGGSTLKDYAQPNGKLGYFQYAFKVYNQADSICNRCLVTPITKIFQGGRATYYCKNCQQ